MPVTQTSRLIALSTPLAEDELLLEGFVGEEAISGLFDFELYLLSDNAAIAFQDVVGRPATVRILKEDDSVVRHINGVVSQFSQGGKEAGFTRYRARLVPWLWLLTRTVDCRIFQNKTVPEIVEQVFQELGFRDYRLLLSNDYRPRTYCVQYQESDFNFVSRLLEAEGICYFFQHQADKHTLLLADAPGLLEPCPGQSSFPYAPVGGPHSGDAVSDWVWECQVRPAKYSSTDFNFETPATDLSVSVPTVKNVGRHDFLEVYEYPGNYLKNADGERYAKLRMEEQETPHTRINAGGDCRALLPGYLFELTDHYRDEYNGEYLVTAVSHQARSNVRGAGYDASYSNSFRCQPKDVPYRPARVTPKPVVQGPQSAIVVGKQGEELWTDKYGRVKVLFHWDREGKADENSSCWVRVSHAWAGKNWGAISLPRIGQEVIVDFLEGDPDQPVITGRFYNGESMPPYELPANATISGTKSLSSKGGGGFNEIRFEDKKGDEQVFVHAQKNYDIRVKKDRFEWTGSDRHLIVKKDKFEHVENDRHELIDNHHQEEVGGDRHVKVKGKQALEVGGSHSFTVSGNVMEVFQANHSEQTSKNYYLKATGVVVEAMTGVTVKCAGSSVVIDPAGVTLKGPTITLDGSLVKIASGPGSAAMPGSAGSAVPAAAPGQALEADTADPGEMAEFKLKQRADESGKYGAPAVKPFRPAPDDEGSESDDRPQQRHWIEIELVDEEDNPVPGERYEITLPDGETVAKGTLDENGFARVDGIEDPGNCQVTFPELDREAWEPA